MRFYALEYACNEWLEYIYVYVSRSHNTAHASKFNLCSASLSPARHYHPTLIQFRSIEIIKHRRCVCVCRGCLALDAANMRRNAKMQNTIISICIAHLIACHYQPASGYAECSRVLYVHCAAARIYCTWISYAWIWCICCNYDGDEMRFFVCIYKYIQLARGMVHVSAWIRWDCEPFENNSILYCIELKFAPAKYRHKSEYENANIEGKRTRPTSRSIILSSPLHRFYRKMWPFRKTVKLICWCCWWKIISLGVCIWESTFQLTSHLVWIPHHRSYYWISEKMIHSTQSPYHWPKTSPTNWGIHNPREFGDMCIVHDGNWMLYVAMNLYLREIFSTNSIE